MRLVCIVSGGIDSCFALSVTKGKYPDADFFLLHFNYGQKTESKELEYFIKIADYYNIPRDVLRRKVVTIDFFKDYKCSLIKGNPNDPKLTYLPFRNGVFLSIAVSYAEEIEAEKIITGSMKFDYGDGSKNFIDQFNKSVDCSFKDINGKSKKKIVIEAPLVGLGKNRIVELAEKSGVPIKNITWSCYFNENEPCNNCKACELRNAALNSLKRRSKKL